MIQHRTITGQDGYNNDVISWTADTSGPLWAAYEQQGGREFYRIQQTFAEAVAAFTVRFQSSLTINREDRLVWRNRSDMTFDILGVEEVVLKRELRIICRKLVA